MEAYPVTVPRVHAQSRFWWVTLAAFLAVGATARLGFWQLDRAVQKQALEAAVQAQALLPPLDTPAFLAAWQGGAAQTAGMLHRRVLLRGRWRVQDTVYLENRPMQGRAGFWVLTPLQLEGSSSYVLVQRGWIARDVQDRTRLAPIHTPDGWVDVQGRWAGEPSRLLELSGTGQNPGVSRIRQNLDTAAFAAETGLALAPGSVLQTGGDGDGMQRQWPAYAAGVEKHQGYAFQWFGLSGLLVLLYVWFQLVRPFLFRSSSAQ